MSERGGRVEVFSLLSATGRYAQQFVQHRNKSRPSLVVEQTKGCGCWDKDRREVRLEVAASLRNKEEASQRREVGKMQTGLHVCRCAVANAADAVISGVR